MGLRFLSRFPYAIVLGRIWSAGAEPRAKVEYPLLKDCWTFWVKSLRQVRVGGKFTYRPMVLMLLVANSCRFSQMISDLSQLRPVLKRSWK